MLSTKKSEGSSPRSLMSGPSLRFPHLNTFTEG